jgi:hypothetical protein
LPESGKQLNTKQEDYIMGNFFDDFDAEDFAFWGGFIETQLEGEKEEKIDNEPLTPDEMLETPFDYLDVDEEE